MNPGIHTDPDIVAIFNRIDDESDELLNKVLIENYRLLAQTPIDQWPWHRVPSKFRTAEHNKSHAAVIERYNSEDYINSRRLEIVKLEEDIASYDKNEAIEAYMIGECIDVSGHKACFPLPRQDAEFIVHHQYKNMVTDLLEIKKEIEIHDRGVRVRLSDNTLEHYDMKTGDKVNYYD